MNGTSHAELKKMRTTTTKLPRKMMMMTAMKITKRTKKMMMTLMKMMKMMTLKMTKKMMMTAMTPLLLAPRALSPS